jgi:hypothetical protein
MPSAGRSRAKRLLPVRQSRLTTRNIEYYALHTGGSNPAPSATLSNRFCWSLRLCRWMRNRPEFPRVCGRHTGKCGQERPLSDRRCAEDGVIISFGGCCGTTRDRGCRGRRLKHRFNPGRTGAGPAPVEGLHSLRGAGPGSLGAARRPRQDLYPA